MVFCHKFERFVDIGPFLGALGLRPFGGEFLVLQKNPFERQADQSGAGAGGREAVAGIMPMAIGVLVGVKISANASKGARTGTPCLREPHTASMANCVLDMDATVAKVGL